MSQNKPRILVFQHIALEHPGIFRDFLAEEGVGWDAVELDARGEFRPSDFTATAIRQLRKTLDDLNLHVCAVSFRTRRGYNVMEDLQQRIDATKAAGRLQVPRFSRKVFAWPVPPPPLKSEAASA